MNKKIFKLLILNIIFLFSLFLITGCDEEKEDHSLKLIGIDKSTLQEEYELYNIDLSEVKIKLTYNDGTVSYVPFDLDYLMDGETSKLQKEGRQTLYFLYEGFYSTITLNIVSGGNVYTTGTVNIFTMNDTHGSLITDDIEYNGLDKVTTVINSLSDDYIKISDGDFFQGSYFSNYYYGLPGIEWMNYMDFDCFVLGNHEFDWGIDKIARFKDGDESNGEANFPFLGCNIYDSTGSTLDWVEPYTIVNNNGYRVGIIGCMGEDLESSIAARRLNGIYFTDPLPLISEYAKELRTEKGCEVVIVAIHEYETYTNNRIAKLSGNSRIDAIICGHTHSDQTDYLLRNDGYSIPVIECASNNRTVGTVILNMSGNKPTGGKINHINVSSKSSHQGAYNVLSHYYEPIKSKMDQVIGYTSSELSKSYMCHVIANGIRDMFDSDIGVVNNGGIRSGINRGDITFGDLYKVIPFDNTVYVCYIKGSRLKNFLNSSLSCDTDYNVSNISNTETYKVSVISYVFENYNMDIYCESYEDTEELVFDVCEEWFTLNWLR